MSETTKVRILDLCEKTPESLLDFFAQNGCELVERELAENYADLDFILTDSEEQARLASKDFHCDKNEITLVCLAGVKETRSFLLNNGRLVIDPDFAGTAAGPAILTKFFLNRHAVRLDESFSGLFSGSESFRVVNHLSCGTSLDELSMEAFEQGFNIVSLRSFLDHVLYYFTYLKQAGLAGIPVEVEHAFSKDLFGVNIHAPVKNFTAEYLLDSFGSVNSSDPIQYLLGVAARSADFLDVTHIERPGRLVLGAFWSKEGQRSRSGIAFNNIYTVSQFSAKLERKIKEYRPAQAREREDGDKAERLKTKSLPGGILALALEDGKGALFGADAEKGSNLIAFVIGRFEEVYPDSSVNEIDENDLDRFLKDYPEQEVVQNLGPDEKEDLLEKIRKKNITDAYTEELRRVRDNLKEDDDFKKELSDSFGEEVARRAAGRLDAETLNRIMGGEKEEEDLTRVGGKEDADEFRALVKGMKEDDKGEFVQRISGDFESKAGEFSAAISSFEDDPKKGLFNFVSSAMGALDDAGMDARAKSFFKSKAPQKIAKGLENYAFKRGLNLEDLKEDHLLEFKSSFLPEIVEDTFSDDFSIEEFAKDLSKDLAEGPDLKLGLAENTSPEFRDKLREKLLPKLEEFEGLEERDGQFYFTDESVSREKAKKVIEGAMKEALEEDLRFGQGSREEIEEKEKKIIEEFSKTFGKEEDEIAEIVRGASSKAKEAEGRKVVESLFKDKPGEKEDVVVEGFGSANGKDEESKEQERDPDKQNSSLEDAHLLKRLKAAEEENKKLKDNLKAMEVKLASEGEKNAVVERVSMQAGEEVDKEGIPRGKQGFDEVAANVEEAVDEVDKEAMAKLKAGRPLSEEESQKLARALEKEQELLQAAKDAQTNVRRMQAEFGKKEGLYSSELAKLSKTVKSKEAVVDKMKESMRQIVEKKQKELGEYKRQNELLNQRLKDDRASRLESQLKSANKELDSVSRLAEMYKSKVENMLKSQKKNDGKDQVKQLVNENRSLSREKIQLENKLSAETRGKKSLENQLSKLKDQDAKLRASLNAAESKHKKAMEEADKLKASEARLNAMLAKKGEAAAGADAKSDKELESLKAANAQLQASIKEMASKLKSGDGAQAQAAQAAGQPSVKEKRLEQSVKKLNGELSKARNEVTESKKQIMKLKNEAVGLKNKIKQLEKAKGGKKKAA